MAALYLGSRIHAVCVLYAYKYGENCIIHYSLNVFVCFFSFTPCALHCWTCGAAQLVRIHWIVPACESGTPVVAQCMKVALLRHSIV